MKRRKIYFDTSFLSHLKADDTPEKMADSLMLWRDIVNGKFDILISNVTLEELDECPEPKQSILLGFLKQAKFELLEETAESIELTEKYLTLGVLKQKSRDDLRHISLAVIAECDYIVSWNFKHFVNVNVINKVQAVNKLLGYSEIIIVPPSMLLEGEDDDD